MDHPGVGHGCVGDLIDTIRAALVTEASDDSRAAGASACRTILTALEATPGQALAPVTAPASQMAAVVSALRGMPPEQMLDLAISRLRAALPAGTEVAPVAPLKFHLIQLPARGGS